MRRLTPLLALLLALAACGGPAAAPGKPSAMIQLHLGTPSAAAPSAVVPVTKYAGLYEKYGLDADVQVLNGAPNLLAAMISGQVPITYQGSPEVVRAALGGADVVMFAGVINTIFFSIYTRPDITEASQLKGKRIGYASGGNDEAGARVAMTHFNLRIPQDVTPFNMPTDQAARVAALQNGSVDAISLAPPFAYEARKVGMRELINTGDLGLEFQSGTFATPRAYLKDHRDVVVRFTQAMSEGIKYYKTNKEGSIKALSEYTKSTDPDILQQSWEDFALKYTTKVPHLTIKGLQYVMDNLITDPAVKSHKPEDFIDESVIKQLEDEGFYRQLWGNDL